MRISGITEMKTTEEWMSETMQPIIDRIAGGPMNKHTCAHTPGPWTYQEEGDEPISPRVVVMHDDGACGDPECCGSPTYWMHIKPADGRLIAAAPDLLRAAKQAEEDMAWAESAVHGTNFQAALILLRAAIAKATGISHG